MKTKSLFAIATFMMVVHSTVSAQATNHRDLPKPIEIGRCPQCPFTNVDSNSTPLRGTHLRNRDWRVDRLLLVNHDPPLLPSPIPSLDPSFPSFPPQIPSLDPSIPSLDLSVPSFPSQIPALDPTILPSLNDRFDPFGNQRPFLESEDGEIALELFSQGGDDVKLTIDAVEGYGRQEVHFGPAVVKERIYLAPNLYRLRFFNGRGTKMWMSGQLDLRRRRTDTIRISFSRRNRSILVENDPKAWNSD